MPCKASNASQTSLAASSCALTSHTEAMNGPSMRRSLTSFKPRPTCDNSVSVDHQQTESTWARSTTGPATSTRS